MESTLPIDIQVLCRRLNPSDTILVFGSGSSFPSGGPIGSELSAAIAKKFDIENGGSLSLADAATIAEKKTDRRTLVDFLRSKLEHLSPSKGIINLPMFDWAGIYTTNFDKIIERAYERANKSLSVTASNFDFGAGPPVSEQSLYKLHGTIDADISLGHRHHMVITGRDFDSTSEYRDLLWSRFADQLAHRNVVIIGHSLGDPDLKRFVEHANELKRKRGAPGSIQLFIYEHDANQALIHEERGYTVCFGGIDEFFAELSKKIAPAISLLPGITDDPLDRARIVHPSTLNVSSERAAGTGDLPRMFNGSPASYADIMRGWTFERTFAQTLESQLATDNERVSYVIGTAGSGKTTGIRKALSQLVDRDIQCWEHANDLPLPFEGWISIDDELRKRSQIGVLFIDDAHYHLREINRMVEAITARSPAALKLVLASSKANWNPRLKSPAIYKYGKIYTPNRLSGSEIDSLIEIIDLRSEIASLVEDRFKGFSRSEKRQRLTERCGSDMFVCMKNIFGFDTFDDIILREYADLSDDYQEVYRRVAAMESAGIRVHRQLVIRTVGIQASQIARVTDDLDGIIREYTVSERDGIYGWQVRHPVIADIVRRYKFSDPEEFFQLLDQTVSNLNPTYRIEISSINEICNMKRGIGAIPNRQKQNELLRKMISLAPRERVPRHRLITNLIKLGEYDPAETEIRIFENELRRDGPVQRYKVQLLLQRAKTAVGLMDEDREALAREAAAEAQSGVDRFSDDKNIYRSYLEAGVACYKFGGKADIFDDAMSTAKSAYDRILDPELRRIITIFERIEDQFHHAASEHLN